VRLQDGLGAIDGDVNDPALSARTWDIVGEIAPEVADRAPARFGGGQHKVAWFVRIEGEAFIRVGTRKYSDPAELAQWKQALAAAAAEALEGTAPRAVPKPAYHCLEIFGGAPNAEGNCSRQFAVFGPHTTVNGEVRVRYRWMDDSSLLNVPLAQLPVLTKKQAYAIVAAFEKAAEELGWEALNEADEGSGAGTDIYDISRTKSRFDVVGHGRVDYAELETLVSSGEHVVLSASFIPNEITDTPDRCKAVWSPRYNCVVVKDWKTAARHYPDDVQTDGTLKAVADILAKLAQSKSSSPPPGEEDEREPPEPKHDAPREDKLLYLVQTRGFFESEDAAVRLYATSLDCRTKISAFKMRYRAWSEFKGVKELLVTDMWERIPQRVNIAGVRMRPDRPFPLYREGGMTFKNVYRRPIHVGGGSLRPFMEFLERFLPDAREREWLLDWMAHKLARPEIPGTAVVFVADNEEGTREGVFGTGRGLLFRIVRELFGTEYARSQSFSMLEGSNGQAVFNDWMHGSVLVTVDESRTSATAHRRGERSAVYEVLKDIVDPAPKLFNFKGKYRAAFDGMSYCSFWVATNHADALAIPASDRRFTVLRNGRQMTLEERNAIVAWLEQPANIGALAAFLKDRDLAGFDMFLPLATTGKAEMAELALSSVEQIMLDMIADEDLGKVFVKKHFETALARHFNASDSYWTGELRGAWHRYCVMVKSETGTPRRIRTEGTKKKLFCFRAHARTAAVMPEVALRREAGKWGHVDGLRDPLSGLAGGKDPTEKDE
jgi:hypothetical protein